jgi:HSP20 family protein
MGALIRFDPFRDLSAMQARMNRLFDEVFGRQTGGSSSGDMAPAFVPAVDVWEVPDAYYLRVELPGVNKDAVQIELTNGVLVIRGERKLGANLETEQWVRQEGRYGPFYRAVTLPGSAQAEKIQARVQHGVLAIIVPKAEEARTKLIPIAA